MCISSVISTTIGSELMLINAQEVPASIKITPTTGTLPSTGRRVRLMVKLLAGITAMATMHSVNPTIPTLIVFRRPARPPMYPAGSAIKTKNSES